MDADGSVGGRGSLRAPLGMAAIDPLSVTNIDMDGYHLSRNIGFDGVGNRKGRAFLL